MLIDTTSHAPVMGEHPDFEVPRNHLTPQTEKSSSQGPLLLLRLKFILATPLGAASPPHSKHTLSPNTNLPSSAVTELVEHHGPGVQ